MSSNQVSPQAELMKMIVAKWVSKPIYLVAKLGIADLLSENPKTIEKLAQRTNSKPDLLYRIMRALASVGIFHEGENHTFSLTPMADFLKSNRLRAAALLFNAEWNDQAWLHLAECIQTGETPFQKAHNSDLTEWLNQNQEAEKIFIQANAIKAATSQKTIITAYDFSKFRTLTDVGGGAGTLIVEILNAYPQLKGRITDLPTVIENAREILKKSSVGNRCELLSCDFFTSVPAGSSAYLLSNILHDWSDLKCKIILDNCAQAMDVNAKLLIAEMVIEPGNAPSIAKLLDLEMFVLNGGKERTLEEFRTLLAASGLELLTLHRTIEGVALLECYKKA